MTSGRNTPRRITWEFWMYAVPTLLLLLVWGCGKSSSSKSESEKSKSGTPSGGLGALFGGRHTPHSKNNLKQIGLALHNYHEVHAVFPPGGIYDKQKKGYHSWQTSLLPFVEMGPLFDRIDFNQPWDSPKNKPHFKTEVPPYLLLKSANLDRTNSDGLGLSHYAANKNVFFANSSHRFRDFTDGMANTFLAAEVSAGLKPWGDPTNTRDLAKGLGSTADQFGGVHGDRTILLMADGSVHEFKNDVDPNILKAFATPNGGEKVPEF